MTPANQTRMQALLQAPALTPAEDAELDQLMYEGELESQEAYFLRESARELWAEQGGYAAGLPRPV